MYWGAALIAGAGSLVPGVTDSRGGLLPAAAAVFVALGAWLVHRRRVTASSVHPLTLGAVLAGNALVSCMEDPVGQAVAAGWNLMIPMYLSVSLSRRALVGYLAVCTACASVLVGLVPGSGMLVALRVVAAAGLVGLPLAYLLGLRSELDRALASARDLARTDSLTALLNRRGLQERFPALARAAAGRSGRLAALSLDLDHFKRINDTLGHATGDAVLVAAARTVMAASRTEDVVVRLGGEEIVVLSVVTSADDAVAAAERLRELVRDAGRTWSLTTSVGVAVSDTLLADLDTEAAMALLADLLEEADRCLYRAKAAGRDCVATSGDCLATPST